MRAATRVRCLTPLKTLYRLSEPLDGHTYVVVSAAVVPHSGPETYIFGADADGNVADMDELQGSFRGDMNHETALRYAGYVIENPEANYDDESMFDIN
jgi:hypothetical protein